MASTKITSLSGVLDADISATDVLPLVDTAGTPTTYKVTLAQMRTALLAASGAGWTAADYVGMGAGTVPSSGMIRSGQGAITADSPLVNSTATWNNVAVTFRHLLVNVTDTASAAGSLLADWQVGGVTKFSVSKAGAVTSGTVNGQTISSTASFTGSVAVASGLTVSAGTTAVQALTATQVTSSGAVTVTGNTGAGVGSLYIDATDGLTIRGKTGASYDFIVATASAGYLIRNPTGTANLQIPTGSLTVGGGVTVSAGGLAVTGGITGTLQTAAQPNITSVGVLASPHMTSPVIDSGGLTVTAGTIAASSSLVQSGNLQVFNTWDGGATAGVLKLTSDTAATATAGAASLPATPAGFLKWRLGASAVLIPYYNV